MSKIEDQFPGSNMFDLRGKQSVRATFKLSQKAIDAIGLVAIHMGIKQKSLFDHIIEDIDALDDLARTIRVQKFKQIPRKQKTFVLSRRTIDALAAISQEHGTPRDALVEYSIKKLEAVIQAEKLKHAERLKLQLEMKNAFDQVLAVYRKSASVLGEEDPFSRHLAKAVLACRKTDEDLSEFIERSRMLEEF